MYRSEEHQISFFDFNQSCGMQLNKDNEWVKLAGQIDWHRLEETYAAMFPSKKGRSAFPFRTAYGALIIQKRLNLSDRKLLQAIAENPYLQLLTIISRYWNCTNSRSICLTTRHTPLSTGS